jgi:tight adherence protein C
VELTTEVIGVILAGIAFLAVLGGAAALQTLTNPERTARDRLADLSTKKDEDTGLFVEARQSGALGARMSALARPADGAEADQMKRWLLQAGFRARSAVDTYALTRAGLALGLGAVGFAATQGQQLIFIALGALVGVALGYYGPKIFVDNRRDSRQAILLKSFPDAMDLLVSSVEAGLGLDAAFRRVAKEMEGVAPDLAAELQMVNYEVEAGVPRVEALRRLDHRTGLEEVNSLVNVLLQAERFGTSVARALRDHSDLVRRKRMLAAEEKAAKISPKLTVAMIIFIMPTLFTVLAGPAAINIMTNVIPKMSGNR